MFAHGNLAAVALACCAILGCGKGEDRKGGEGAPVPSASAAGGTSSAAGRQPRSTDDFVGKVRVVNLYSEPGGAAKTIDVWVPGTPQHAPLLLAGGIEVGQASDWFSVPENGRAVIAEAGKGDAQPLAQLQKARQGDSITAVFFPAAADPSLRSIYEVEAGKPPRELEGPPPAGKGFVTLLAPQLEPHEAGLTNAFGGIKFHIGTGKGTCPQQRVAGGNAGQLLGLQPAFLDLDPGRVTITLHKWPARVTCESEPVHQFDIDVTADASTLVFVYTPDGSSLAAMQLARTPPE